MIYYSEFCTEDILEKWLINTELLSDFDRLLKERNIAVDYDENVVISLYM